ncbi:MAG: DUF47 domain-containing protein [Negativicutes bacterium]|jgi:hypothetical protein
MDTKKLFNRLFPPKYDFFETLRRQAEFTSEGVRRLEKWLVDRSDRNYDRMLSLAEEADRVRFKMEADLSEAFLTPFSRQDIYIFSVRMNRIIEAAKSTMFSCKVYDCPTDNVILGMSLALSRGAKSLSDATSMLEKNPRHAERLIDNMRQEKYLIVIQYREALAEMFKLEISSDTLKRREIYRELRDVAEHVDIVVDVLHRIVVRLY